ncbi:UNVERIFIED_CONTAM: hypothetical protein Sradi_2056100 [Sesamum radiatum]|uniref:Integrase catalytic domain-containing protein n=1 Tax=Sesamum radiatum TaxID=300843 RepID=A0AAW2TI00_SESRA
MSDRDRLFLSQFWRELFRHSGTTLSYSSVYHPQTGGQTKVLNYVLQNFLHYFVSEEQRRWLQYLYLAEYWYNCTHHSAIGMSPFQALYGRTPPMPLHYIDGASSVVAADEHLHLQQQVLDLAKYHLSRPPPNEDSY